MRQIGTASFACSSICAVLSACILYIAAPAEAIGQQQDISVRVPESAALIEARKKVKDIGWEIQRAEGDSRQLSPPMRTTDSRGTTFSADKQRQYEINRTRIDRKIRDLREERTTWELRVSQLVAAEDERNRAPR